MYILTVEGKDFSFPRPQAVGHVVIGTYDTPEDALKVVMKPYVNEGDLIDQLYWERQNYRVSTISVDDVTWILTDLEAHLKERVEVGGG